MTNSIHDIGEAGCILAIGTNTTETHPVTALEIIRSVRNGGKLIVANPRDIPLVRWADVWLRHHPGSDVALLMGVLDLVRFEKGIARLRNPDDLARLGVSFDQR